MQDYSKCFRILGLQENATPKEIKRAYRRLSLQYHPDRNLGYNDGKKFKEITEAYQILRSKQREKKKSSGKSTESTYAEFWQFYNKQDEKSHTYQKRNFYYFNGDFGQKTFESTPPTNQEKPISQKITHILLYGGLGAIAIWIILSEILK